MQVRLGELTVDKVVEMVSGMPMGMVLPDIGAGDLERLKPWYWDDTLSVDPAVAQCTISVHSYIVRFAGKTILVDACNGNHKNRSIPFAHRLNTSWLEGLRALGVEPQDIDLVMCTHLHADHVGWNTRLHEGRWVPTFPNAQYLFGKRDMDHFGQQDHEAFHREAYDDSVLPVIEAGQARIVAENAAIIGEPGDGIWLEPAFGHSPGSLVIHACDGGAHAVFSGDVMHHPVQLVRPEAHFFADWDAPQAALTRRALLESVADSRTVLMPAHFCGVSAGHVRSDAGAFRYEFLS